MIHLDIFEVPCDVDFRFYGTDGEQANACAESGDTVAIECHPDDRPQLIVLLRELLSLAEAAPQSTETKEPTP